MLAKGRPPTSNDDPVASDVSPLVFLAGPPGSGKTTLGTLACAEPRWRFEDLVDPSTAGEAIAALIETQTADVVALPWAPDRDRRWLERCRQSGGIVALWAHPLDMQGRSKRSEPLFTPVGRLTTRSGFGRNGTGSREYRHLARACEHTLIIVGMTEDEASRELTALIEDLRNTEGRSPAELEGITDWADYWRDDPGANKQACEILVDAMARYTVHRRAEGASPRAMSSLCGDINTAGLLVMYCEAPKGKKVLEFFSSGPSEYDFRRKISESPRAWARYSRTWRAFAEWLRASGRVEE